MLSFCVLCTAMVSLVSECRGLVLVLEGGLYLVVSHLSHHLSRREASCLVMPKGDELWSISVVH